MKMRFVSSELLSLIPIILAGLFGAPGAQAVAEALRGRK